MKITEVNSKSTRKAFFDLGRKLYRNDPDYTPVMDNEIESIFDPDKNSCFKHGDATRFLLLNDQGEVIGRTGVFVNYQKARRAQIPAGGIGFFECIDDQKAANVLFDAAKEWLADKEVEAMDGDVTFGENYNHWGLLVDGFMHQSYGMPYNKPYYKRLFEEYGFREYFKQFSYHKNLEEEFPSRIVKFAEFLETRPGYTFEHYRKKNADKYLEDLMVILNTTWEDYLQDFNPVTMDEMQTIKEGADSIIDEDFIWFAYKDGNPIGIVVVMPDVNQILKKFRGKFDMLKGLQFILLKKMKYITRCRVVMAGVVPEYQNSGVIAALFLQFVKVLRKKPQYKEMELSWVGDFNPRMRKIYEQVGGVHSKTHATYRYLFDRNRPFERFTNEEGNSALRKDAVKDIKS